MKMKITRIIFLFNMNKLLASTILKKMKRISKKAQIKII